MPTPALASDISGLMHNRGFVLTRFCGRTDTAATKDPLGIPESGSISTRTQSCRLRNSSKNKGKLKRKVTTDKFMKDVEDFSPPGM